jgi:hypothetical protein
VKIKKGIIQMLFQIRLLVILILIIVSTQIVRADCGPFGCAFQPGTVCVNGQCVLKDVPVPTPTPSVTHIPIPTPSPKITQIHLKSLPLKDIIPEKLSCSKYDSVNLEVNLSRIIPPPLASFFSTVVYNSKDLKGLPIATIFVAQKDILNRFVFIRLDTGDKLRAQFYGTDFVFNQWNNKAFIEVLKNTPCSELASTGVIMAYGISFKDDLSDFEGASFSFENEVGVKH